MTIGIDTTAIDTAVRPEDDLYGFVNGRWMETPHIPADRARYGAFDTLVEKSEAAMREIIEGAATQVANAADPSSLPPIIARVGALFASFMDTDRIERDGLTPIVGDLEQIASVDDARSFAHTLGSLERGGLSGLFGMYVTADAGNPEVEIAYVGQGGIGLPDRDYYTADQYAEIRSLYTDYLAEMFRLARPGCDSVGVQLDDDAASAVVALETRIAEAHWDKADTRDAVKTYNKMGRADVEASTPDFDWAAWLSGLGADPKVLEQLVVAQPDAIATTVEIIMGAPLAVRTAWLVARLLGKSAPYLTDEISAAHFAFFGTALSGIPEQKVRWKRGVALVESLLGDDAGQLYVERHYPERAAERMDQLVANVIEAFHDRISTLEWMGPDTRAEALTKLSRFRAKVGKPSEWKNYDAYEVRVDDLLGNVRRGNAVETDRQLAKVGQPVDRDEWLMTPQTVNAYYHPLLNEIVFPAAILQPPFFDVDAPDAINYGGIGAVIAHEIGHGFDDQGSRFDGHGALRDWWTDADRAAFDARAQVLIDQFNSLSPRNAPDKTVNGALTVGENIGDLCGIEMSFAALQRAQADGPPTTLADRTFSRDQLFFLNWAQLWRTQTRSEEVERLLTVDPHSPPDLRANIVSNVDAFHDAFATTEEDAMWLDPSDRVRVF